MREIRLDKWNRLLSFWESHKAGNPSIFIKTEEQLEELIETLKQIKDNATFGEREGVAFSFYENGSDWINENPNRPKWNLSAKISAPKEEEVIGGYDESEATAKYDKSKMAEEEGEDLPFDEKGNEITEPPADDEKLPWE